MFNAFTYSYSTHAKMGVYVSAYLLVLLDSAYWIIISLIVNYVVLIFAN